MASTAARMGFERAMTRHIAAELAIGAPALARAALLLGVFATLLGGAVAAIATFALASPAALHVFGQPELAAPLALSAAAVVPQTLMVVAGSVLAGLNRGVASQVVQNALWPVVDAGGLGAWGAQRRGACARHGRRDDDLDANGNRARRHPA